MAADDFTRTATRTGEPLHDLEDPVAVPRLVIAGAAIGFRVACKRRNSVTSLAGYGDAGIAESSAGIAAAGVAFGSTVVAVESRTKIARSK
jgi:hypothetical protein